MSSIFLKKNKTKNRPRGSSAPSEGATKSIERNIILKELSQMKGQVQRTERRREAN